VRSVDREEQQGVVFIDVLKDTANSITDAHSCWIVRYQPSGEARAVVEFHDRENLGLIARGQPRGWLPGDGHTVDDASSGDLVPEHIWAEAARAV
jgi:hypothetical protein